MTKLIIEDIKEIVKKKRFIIMMAIAYIGLLVATIYTKVKFWNDVTYTFSVHSYMYAWFNLVVGIALIISIYRLKFTKNSILLVEKFECKRFQGVLSKTIASAIILLGAYIILAVLTILLGILLGAHCSFDQTVTTLLKMCTDYFAILATLAYCYFFLYLFAFPVVPVILYVLLMAVVSGVLRFYDFYADVVPRTMSFFIPKLNADIVYTGLILYNPNFALMALFIAHLAIPTLLSMLVFKLKRVKDKKKGKKKAAVADEENTTAANEDNVSTVGDDNANAVGDENLTQ